MIKHYRILLLLIAILFTSISNNTKAQTLPYLDPNLPVEQRVSDLMNRMTLDEKIGQMIQIDLPGISGNPSNITSYTIGSVLSGGNSDPSAGNSPVNWADTYDLLQGYALKTRLKIPIIYGVDALHGHNNIYGATIFPHNIGMGCTRNPELIKKASRITAIEIAATGIDWTFAPCVTVPRNERWGRTYEGYGETPELVRVFGSSSVKGLQGNSLSDSTSILACAKHFLGDGGTTNGKDQGNTELDEKTIREIHLPGYVSSIDSGVGSIMVSYSSINGLKMHGNKKWITDILKNELGFKGLVVSDYAGIDQLNSDHKSCVETAINAGIDMAMIPVRYEEFFTNLKSLVNEGKVSMSRIDDAVKRILTIKFQLGLFEKPYANRNLLPLIGCDEHRRVARECVRESMVLLKKKDGILPLRKNARILVAGDNADNLGYQCGGWTIDWQGGSGNITVGTTILQGMKNIAPNADIEYSAAGDFTNTHSDYSIVIIGEKPYAEGLGDSKDLNIAVTDIELIKKIKSFGAPVIVVLISGRPMILEKILHYSDAIFAAWLPGTEGQGVADVLFGDAKPKGLLSHSWPRNMEQIPINIGDKNYNPLYPYGYGITSFSDSQVGSAPVLLSAIATEDGKHLEVTFNKQMKDPSGNNFLLSKNGLPFPVKQTLSLKENDNTTIIISLDSAYRIEDSIAISYNSGNIVAKDDGLLQPFNSFDVCSLVNARQ